jgi:hypothetical protein
VPPLGLAHLPVAAWWSRVLIPSASSQQWVTSAWDMRYPSLPCESHRAGA